MRTCDTPFGLGPRQNLFSRRLRHGRPSQNAYWAEWAQGIVPAGHPMRNIFGLREYREMVLLREAGAPVPKEFSEEKWCTILAPFPTASQLRLTNAETIYWPQPGYLYALVLCSVYDLAVSVDRSTLDIASQTFSLAGRLTGAADPLKSESKASYNVRLR